MAGLELARISFDQTRLNRVQSQFQMGSKVQMAQEKYGEKQSYLKKKDRAVVGSDAFNLEYDSPPTRDELRRDIVSYLGEYRLQVQKYQYELIFGRDKNKRGPITLRDQDRGEAVAFKTKRVIEERTRKGDPIHREEAEHKGIALLNDQLRSAKTGDTVVWASPPGPKDQGYGDYGFIYAGKVTKFPNGEAHLAMSAIRVEQPMIEQYNKAITALTGENVAHTNAEDFLRAPKIVKKNIADREVDGVLQDKFAFKADEQEKGKFGNIIKQMESLIEDFLDVMEHGSKGEKLKAFYKLENYALKLKEDYKDGEDVVYHRVRSLSDLSDRFGDRPPAVAGSCGSSGDGAGGFMSNGLISSGSSLGGGEVLSMYGRDQYGNRAFKCPSCKKLNIRPHSEMLSNCQHCASKAVAC